MFNRTYKRLNNRELENFIKEVDNRSAKYREDIREDVNLRFISKVYYDAKHDSLVDKLTRFEQVSRDAYTVMSDFTAHKGRLTMLETELDKLNKAIVIVDQKSENRHDKVMNALDIGMNKIQTQLDNKGPRVLNYVLGSFAIVGNLVTLGVILSQHWHP